jgi:hypothetical protein
MIAFANDDGSTCERLVSLHSGGTPVVNDIQAVRSPAAGSAERGCGHSCVFALASAR